MADQPDAFLSYTRLDDEFFGGAITSLRRLLELGVQVVTGDRTFSIFQDVDGIEFGQKWQKRLDEAISTSSFLIPIVTPLFFTSDPCRDELSRFIEHEKSLGRDDMILPVYFVTAPVLERPELLKSDALASEISSRQRYDWRVRADLPPNDPQMRGAVRELAGKIATAMTRGEEPVLADAPETDADDPNAADVSALIKSLGHEREIKPDRRLVLWVDDNPDNNVIERRSMAPYNIEFVIAQSTGQALAELKKQPFAAIISDMVRPPDSQAGYTLLEAVRGSGDQTPFFIYAGWKARAFAGEAVGRGAQGATNRGDELLQMVLAVLKV
jgi:CheY-like chemotaxis protein